MVNKKALGIKDVMEITGYSRSYIYKLIHWKKITYHKPTSGRIFFLPNELEEFVSRGKIVADYEAVKQADTILNKEI
jgi:predicted DNA-binding transcriptional regulator AlpA